VNAAAGGPWVPERGQLHGEWLRFALVSISMGKKPSRERTNVAPPDVDADVLFGDVEGRKAERKERQLCRQVREAISEALAALDDEVLSEVWIAGVEPAPDASRLVVLVEAPETAAPEVIKERFGRVAGYLRSEVAQAISRKRVPTLLFEVLPPEVSR